MKFRIASIVLTMGLFISPFSAFSDEIDLNNLKIDPVGNIIKVDRNTVKKDRNTVKKDKVRIYIINIGGYLQVVSPDIGKNSSFLLDPRTIQGLPNALKNKKELSVIGVEKSAISDRDRVSGATPKPECMFKKEWRYSRNQYAYRECGSECRYPCYTLRGPKHSHKDIEHYHFKVKVRFTAGEES